MDAEKNYLIRISKGDTKAFDSIFLLHYPRVKDFISGLIKNEEDARDLSQDVFLKLWNNREKLPHIDYFKTYLFQISKHIVFDYFRKNTTFEEYTESYVVKDSFSIEEDLESRDLEMLIDALVEQMPPQRKKIFRMSRNEGLTNEEISIRLDLSKRTVETHISSALKDVRKLLLNIMLFFY